MANLLSNLKEAVEILAMSAKKQESYLKDIGFITSSNLENKLLNIDEIALQFEDVYEMIETISTEYGFGQILINNLNGLDELLSEHSGSNAANFWTITSLWNDPRWEKIREKARACLSLMP